jgi:hypothetical protein
MRIATTAAIGLTVLLAACNKPAEAPAASETDAAAPAEATAPAEAPAAAPMEGAAPPEASGDAPASAEETDDDRGGMGDR